MYDHFDDANHLTCDHSMPDEDYFDLAITILHQSSLPRIEIITRDCSLQTHIRLQTLMY